MRICYIHTADFRKQKGSSIHVKELVKPLAKWHSITLLVDKWDDSPLEGVRIIEMNCPTLFNMLWRVVFAGAYLTCILLYGFDVLYAKSPIEGSLAGIAGHLFRVPLIYEVNGLVAEEEKMKGKNKLRVAASFVLEKTAIRLSYHVICVTPWIKGALLREGVPDTRMTVIGNGADINLFSPVSDARETLHLSPERFYIGYVGSLKKWQGLDHLLDVVPLILRELPDTHVLIVGDGELMDWLARSIRTRNLSDCVTLTGPVPHKEVPLYISACDVCILLKKPLSSGYSPLKLYEYMACERAVVASRVKGFECLETEKAGVLADQNDPEEVADAVVALLRDENLRKTMGKNGRVFVLDSHTWEKVAQNVSEVILALNQKPEVTQWE